MSLPYEDDEWEKVARIHPTLRIVIGILVISVINFLYITMWPIWVRFLDTLAQVLTILPPSLLNGDVNVTTAPLATLSLMLGAAFVIAISGVLIFFVIVPALRLGEGQ